MPKRDYYEVLGINKSASPDQIKSVLPIVDLFKFGPAKHFRDNDFGKHQYKIINGSVFFPNGGYVNDPQLATKNLQFATENNGGKFKFNSNVIGILKKNNRVSGVLLSNGEKIYSNVVVNVAGPHSMKINELAGIEHLNNIKTQALKVEVAHVPSPKKFNYEQRGFVVSDSDIGCYSRPDTGNNILIGGDPILSKSINLRTVESEIAKFITEIQNNNDDVEIGSYPFFKAGKLGVSIVIRSPNKAKIDACEAEILELVKSKGIEIVEEV